MSTADVRCTERELTLLAPLDELAPPVRLAVTRWLWEHDVTPSTLVIGTPIERDPGNGVLFWREIQPDGTIVKRWRYGVRDASSRWPTPFPAALAEGEARRQPAPAPSAGASSGQGRRGAIPVA